MNDDSNIVEEMIQGLLLSDSSLRRVGELPVIVRHDCDSVKSEKVALISGGGRYGLESWSNHWVRT